MRYNPVWAGILKYAPGYLSNQRSEACYLRSPHSKAMWATRCDQ